MNSKMRVFYKYIIFFLIILFGYLYADPPNWEDNPGDYSKIATINAIIKYDNEQLVGEDDMLAIFSQNGNVRGVGKRIIAPFGPYVGTPYWELQVRCCTQDDIATETLLFKYYNSSEDAIYAIKEFYQFDSNEILGDINNPIIYNLEYVKLSFSNLTANSIDIAYISNTDIAGYQFNISGIEVESAYGGDSEDVGFNISTGNNTILGFSLSGAVIEDGSGILLTIEFNSSSDNSIVELSNAVISGIGGTMIANNSPLESPLIFSYNQSTLQAFYFFNTVIIDGKEIDANDWVGAFNGDICVGARQWDISLCNGGICDLPAMGNDGGNLTNGYLTAGEVPTFKIYDASENKYYNAISSEDKPWQANDINTIDLLYVEFDECGVYNGTNTGCLELNYNTCSCIGCTDSSACNFSENAKYDDGACWLPEENKDCTGACIAEGDWLDENGFDCLGLCGGDAVIDDCNVCGGDNSTCTDCQGIVNGNNVLDNCGTCDANASNDCVQGCDGVWGSGAVQDSCNVCGGDNNTCKDCNGDINGSAFIDGCGVCVGGATSLEACPTDCLGVDGGTAWRDQCGVCVEAGNISCVQGCDGKWVNDGSELFNDICNICGGDGTTCLDCQGVINGDNIIDNCGTCDSDSSNDCVQGCDGVWGSNHVFDQCNVCDGNGCHDQDCATYPATDYACDGTCIAEGEGLDDNGFDCIGICNGLYSPSFTCVDESYACTPADCLDIELFLKPNDFGIDKIFPNPFNPIANIDFKISQLSLVTLNIYDITGRKIVNVLDDYKAPGNYQISWNAGDNASGIYIIEIISQSNDNINRDFKKILYLK